MPSLAATGEHLSLENLHRSEVFPKRNVKKISTKGEIFDSTFSPASTSNVDTTEDISPKNSPFKLLAGEYFDYFSRLSNGTLVVLTNFRFFVNFDEKQGFYNLPVHSIESIECRDLFYLHIYCKDGRFAKVTFDNNESCLCWFRVLSALTSPLSKLDSLFAFAFYAWYTDSFSDKSSPTFGAKTTNDVNDFDTRFQCESEFARLEFDASLWRIVNLNCEYQFCPTYPKHWIVPALCTDQDVEAAGRYRSLRRVPAVIWRHRSNGAVLVRCSQPESGIFGWRSTDDEKLLQNILASSVVNPVDVANGRQLPNGVCASTISSPASSNGAASKAMLILDARSYTAAWANRAKGGGYESTENYQRCELQFLGLANIHAIRYSFQKMRSLCWEASETGWFQNLDTTQWILHLYALLTSALRVVDALHVDGRTVVVHCSDGWDRTTQIVSLAKLLLDSYYRTMKGFKELIEREWLSFGHKFGERSGFLPGGDVSQRSPVYLQWLDCVRYLLSEYPCAFEFNETYLVKLAQHTYSGLFGTFLCNSVCDYLKQNVGARTFSVWTYLHSPTNCQFRNLLYDDGGGVDQRQRRIGVVLSPRLLQRDLGKIWRGVYCPIDDPSNVRRRRSLSGGNSNSLDADKSMTSTANTLIVSGHLTRAHSCDDLTKNAETGSNEPLAHSMLRSGSESALFNSLTLPKLNLTAKQDFKAAAASEREMVEETVDSLVSSVAAAVDDEVEQLGDIPEHLLLTTPVRPPRRFTPEATSTPGIVLNGLDADEGECSFYSPPPGGFSCSPVQQHMSTSTSDLAKNANCLQCNSQRSRSNGMTFDAASVLNNNNNNGSYVNMTRVVVTSPCCAELTKSSVKSRSTYRTSSTPAEAIDADGLTRVVDESQQRVREIVVGYEKRIEQMQMEIYRLRAYAANNNATNGNFEFSAHRSRNCSKDEMNSECFEPRSFESSKGGLSDTSWEAVDERDAQATLWVPDHATSRCMNCGTEFWAAKRKHHCRNCGKIFCNSCSSFECAVPEEQLFEPVRVCHTCYATLRTPKLASV